MRPRIVSRREPAALKPAWRQVHVGAKWPVRLLLVGLLLTVHLGPARAQDELRAAIGAVLLAANGGPLWKSDGTEGGTVLDTASGFSYPTDLTGVNGTLFFSAIDPTHGRELWKSDGTGAGTVLVKDINP